jgi:hypothetical protein
MLKLVDYVHLKVLVELVQLLQKMGLDYAQEQLEVPVTRCARVGIENRHVSKNSTSVINCQYKSPSFFNI